jgi:ABC-type multidrug transport system fused ATPase/permease subunit
LFVILLLVPVNYYFQNESQNLQKIYRSLTEKRVQIVTEIINAIQLMKLFAYEKLFFKKVSESREKEIKVIKDYQLQQNYLNSIWNFVPYLISLLCFSGYSLMGNKITVGESFAVFSLLTKITDPIFLLPGFFVRLRKLKDSIDNIENFLKKDEKVNLPVNKDMKDNDILFEEASFSWNKKEDHLKKLNLQIKPGHLVAIVGKVGSGKSSLLLSILGEMLQTSGKTCHSGKNFSYLPQKPWMDNENVQNNILFGSKMDKVKLDRIIEACALKPDIHQLNDGLKTKIGEKGVNLSGGQKVRVALARSVYRDNADIFLLDDPLAAVDKGVGQHILDNVIFGELKDKTRLLVTHHVHFLEKADWIVVMQKGEIFEQGSFQDLMKKNSSFQTLIKEFANDKEDKSDLGIEIVKEEKKTTKKSSKKEFEGKTSYYQYASQYSIKMFCMFVVLIFLNYISDSLSDWWLTKWSKDTNFKSFSLNYYIIIYLASGVLKILISLSCSIVGVNFIINTAKSYHDELLNKMIHAKPEFHDKTPSGKIISLFSEDIHVLDARFGSQLISLLDSICSIIISFLFMIYITPLFVLIAIPILYLYYNLSQQSEVTINEITRIHGTTYSLPFSHFKSSMNGLLTIRAFNTEHQFKNENEKLLDNHMRVVYSRTLVQEWFQLRVEFVGAFVTIASSALGILYAGDAGLLRLLLSTCMTISSKLFMFIKRSAQTQSGLLSSAIISHFIDIETEDYDGKLNPSKWPEEGSISVDNVFMRYKPELPPALKGINFAIKPREKIGIVGRTGAGKSSLV